MIQGFARTDQHILETGAKEGWKNGSTAAVAILLDFDLFVANIGDSEIVLAKKKDENSHTAICLTEMHRPNVAEEKERIVAAGGMVVKGRIFGDLAVSRAFGDSHFKVPIAQANYISTLPYLSHVELTEDEDDFIIIACDGVWDKMSHQDAVNFVANHRKTTNDPVELSKLLANEAFKRRSTDNITVVVVVFEWHSEEIKKVAYNHSTVTNDTNSSELPERSERAQE